MKTEDRGQFADLLTATMQVYGTPLSVQAIGIWWSSLEGYSIEQVRAAFSAHVKDPATGKFSPKPADLIGKIQAFDGRPGAEEAWAMVANAIGDERASVVLTEEMHKAFFVADALADDRVAARMAFKEAYTRAIADSRATCVPVKWVHILGHDAAGRETALLEALEKGRLTAQHVAGLLPHRELPAPSVMKLIKGGKQ